MIPSMYAHTVDVNRPTNTPDPVTKKSTPGVTNIATALRCLIEGARSSGKPTAAGDMQIAAYVMTWTPDVNTGPFLVADDIVTFRGRDYYAFDILDDTLRPTNPYMTCSLKSKK